MAPREASDRPSPRIHRRMATLTTALLSCNLLLLSHTSSASPPSSPPTTKVVELTDDNFEHLTQASGGQTTGRWFVDFYAPWCGHCKNLEPVWEQLATKMAEDDGEHAGDGVVVAKIDMTANTRTRDRFQIAGFPTLKLFAGRRMYSYKGERSLEALYAFVTGGYMSVAGSGEDVPPPPSWFEDTMKDLRTRANGNRIVSDLIADMDHIANLRKNAAVVLIGTGFLVGLILGCVLGGRTKRGEEQVKKKKAD